MNTSLPQNWLEIEYRKRRETNPRYSLRAYARSLGIPPGRLSEILSGKRKITAQMAEKISSGLGLTPKQKSVIFANVSKVLHEYDQENFLLEEDSFASIADPIHFAFLSLLETKNFMFDLTWIAKRLGISTIEAREILHRLARLGLVREHSGKLSLTHEGVRTTNDISSSALQKAHKVKINHALTSFEEVPLELRDITSITMAIDLKKLPIAKNLIRDFRFKLAELLENGNQSEVYNLNIQLVPVTKSVTKMEKKI